MFDDFDKNKINEEKSGDAPREQENTVNSEQQEQTANDNFNIFSYVKKETPVQPQEPTESFEKTEPQQEIPTPVQEPVGGQPSDEQQFSYSYTNEQLKQHVGHDQGAYMPRPEVIENPTAGDSGQSYTQSNASNQYYNPAPGGSNMPYQQTTVNQKPKKSFDFKAFFKKNWTYVALGGVSLLLVITIICNIVLLSAVVKKNTVGTSDGGVVSGNTSQGGQSLNISESPTTDTALLPGNTEKLTFAQIAAKVRPSVVSVITYDPTSFGQNSGQGSGIIYSSDGYIVTNAHVINNSKAVHVTVVLSDEREFEATVLGYDTRTDLAVLKIEATGLPAAEFGESDKLVAGDEVIAIGNPGGEQFAGSITNGIVSGINRVIDADSSSTTAMKYIQTNAAINPGNSGGALVNIYGQVIGINTAKISATGYEGLGFAIPIATAKPVIDDLSSLGYVSGRVKLGITCTEVTSSMAQYYNVPTGLMIYSIEKGSDLDGQAQVGDIIDKVDGQDISSLSEMQDICAEKKVGDTVVLDMYRPATSRLQKSSTYTITVHLLEDKGDTETQQTNGF